MNFRSDNEVGAHPLIIDGGEPRFARPCAFYGATNGRRGRATLRQIFQKPDLVSFPVATGTAANVLACRGCTPPRGSIYSHPTAAHRRRRANAPDSIPAPNSSRSTVPQARID